MNRRRLDVLCVVLVGLAACAEVVVLFLLFEAIYAR